VRSPRILIAFLLIALAPVLAAQDGKVFGWKVQSPTATAYLVGSIHVAKPDLYPLSPKLENAFASSANLVVEVDVAAGGADIAQKMMLKATYPDGDSIDQHVSQAILQQADAELQKSGLMLPMFAQFRPWFIAQTILLMESQRLGYSPNNGIDLYFLGKAKGRKKVLELETADFQLDVLNGMTHREQELFLTYTLKEIGNTEKNLQETFTAWKQGDTAQMEKMAADLGKQVPELQAVQRKLIDERNVTMAQKVDAWLKTQDTYFIVVGSAHLVGDNGILNLLKKAGYTIEPL